MSVRGHGNEHTSSLEEQINQLEDNLLRRNFQEPKFVCLLRTKKKEKMTKCKNVFLSIVTYELCLYFIRVYSIGSASNSNKTQKKDTNHPCWERDLLLLISACAKYVHTVLVNEQTNKTPLCCIIFDDKNRFNLFFFCY